MVSAPDPLAKGAEPAVAEWAIPNWRSAALFATKVLVHRARRHLVDAVSGPRRWAAVDSGDFPVILGESRTPLWADERPQERAYQLGKVQNLRRAVAALDRIVVPGGAVFSFWRQIGRASRRRGFVTGRMLQQGCLVPATGGGLCQLSNAVYEAALRSGLRHCRAPCAFPRCSRLGGSRRTRCDGGVELCRSRRFRPRDGIGGIEARLTCDDLVIQVFTARPKRHPRRRRRPHYPPIRPPPRGVARPAAETRCFRH